MIERIIETVPEEWRSAAELATAPLAWIPGLQHALMDFFVEPSAPWAVAAKYVFLAFPALLAVVAIWCTQLALYTLPVRGGRARFVSLLLLAWWDAGRAVWMYWVGIARFAGVAAGWALGLAHLLVRLAAALATTVVAAPSAMRRRATPPSLAVIMLALWCVLEAAVFTLTVRPTMTKVLADIAGVDETSRLIGPAIFLALVVLVMGSFACVQALADAARRREMGLVSRLVIIELFVMFFEVMFLYRQLVLAMVPEAADPIGIRTRLGLTLAMAASAWIGVRGLAWLLFGRHGVGPVLAFISVPSGATAGAESPHHRTSPAWWRPSVDEFERDIEWLHAKSEQVLEFLALPALQLLAAALNFAMILAVARPVFSLPFSGLREVTEQRDLEAAAQLAPRKLSL